MIYTVLQGDHIEKIAAKHRLTFKKIWDHAQNSELRALRKNPNVLQPGDRLFLPDATLRVEDASTNARHRFQAKLPKLWLRLDLKKFFSQNLTVDHCRIYVDSDWHELPIPENGIIEVRIPPKLDEAILEIRDLTYIIKIGELDPVERPLGQIERLRNLGYYVGTNGDTALEVCLKGAVWRFQSDYGLKPTGHCDEVTQGKLLQVHGS
ncbi:MAG: LysM peptidoglycan-binding domain-containing protein [Verrucomicrobiales bacterium]|nr:LysM peptidoglycan-binding domain-containing protein [Verrucomicrobiales bacterium]